MIPVVKREYVEVPLRQIDPPENAMRETFEEEDLRELTEDIRINGVQVALIVERQGDRFRISAGHRRFIVATALGAATVPCDIREPGELDAEAIKVLENDVREQVNAAETGAYLMRLFETRAGHDVDKLCSIVRRSRSYIEDRMLLVQGDADVLRAVRQKLISFAVSKELNRVKQVGYRRLYLQNAIEGEASSKVVRDWRKKLELQDGAQADAGAGAAGGAALELEPAPSHLACICCKQVENTNRLKLVYVHDYCELAVLDRALRQFRDSIVGGADAT